MVKTSSAGYQPPKNHLPLKQVLIFGGLLVTLSMGIRHGFGLWMQPLTQARGWTRETYALAMAIQNISWGIAGILAGMAADRFGAFRVLVMGAAVALRLDRIEWGLLLLAMGLVWIAEAFNTALEFLADEVSAEHRDRIGKAKDAAAGGVLLAAVVAMAIGCCVFVPHFKSVRLWL